MAARKKTTRKAATAKHSDLAASESTLQWLVSFLSWAMILTATALYAAVSLAPKLVNWSELRSEYRRTQSQLVYLEQQVSDVEKIVQTLEEKPELLEELARVDLDTVKSDEERIPVGAELTLQSRVTMQRNYEPDVTRAWYVPILSAFATNTRLRTVSLIVAAALVVISFTFFHPSQAQSFSSGWKSIREGAAFVASRYREVGRGD